MTLLIRRFKTLASAHATLALVQGDSLTQTQEVHRLIQVAACLSPLQLKLCLSLPHTRRNSSCQGCCNLAANAAIFFFLLFLFLLFPKLMYNYHD